MSIENATLNDKARESLECPVCLEFSKPPIFVCSNGHHVCNRCQPSLQRCPTCREERRPNTRCIALEIIAKYVKFPCKNQQEGCKAIHNFSDMAVHWEICKKMHLHECKIYVTYTHGDGDSSSDLDSDYDEEEVVSNLLQCDWKGSRNDLMDHVKRDHPGCFLEKEIFWNEVNMVFDKQIRYKKLVYVFGELFWVQLRHHLANRATYIWASYVGDAECAAKYESQFTYVSYDGRVKETICTQTYAEGEFHYSGEGVLLLRNEKMRKFVAEDTFSFSVRIQKK